MGTSSSTFGKTYLYGVPATGILVISYALFTLLERPPATSWYLLTGLTALTGAYTVKIPGLVVRLSLSEPLVFLATLLFGPAAGTLTAAVDALVMSLRLVPRLRTPHRILFNVGGIALSLWPSAHVYFFLTGLDPSRPEHGPIDTFVLPLYLFAALLFLANSSLVAIALSIERGVSAISIWARQFLWLSASYFASAAIAAILVVLVSRLDFALVGLLLPLVLVSFFVVRTSLGRLEDSQKHLKEVNHLYLSTIETLAMAIDAKDQVTHGHIRRVQQLAVGLSKHLGVTDDAQLRAIEAAALLHDMGKLAIPEFILNKPGRLTPSEFRVMQTHAAIGADILSAIDFPYPVVPIVRHHHENWDGSGYPDRLRGSDIPIGARVLSVVDCYDALTSDRPYRPALPDETALEILMQRRGKMYDPFVVDAFVNNFSSLRQMLDELTPAPPIAPHPQESLVDNAPAVVAASDRREAFESLRLLVTTAPFPPARSAEVLLLQLSRHLRAIADFSTIAFFSDSTGNGALTALFVEGPAKDTISGLTFSPGERLTGWVAAHRTAVWNSDAALDLHGAAATPSLALASAVPLVDNNDIVAVLTLYSNRGEEIAAGARRAIESLIPVVARAVAEARFVGSNVIDGRELVIRQAAMLAFESLTSHGSPGVSVLLTLRPISGSQGSTADITRVATLANRAFPANRTGRIAVLLTNRHLLAYVTDLAHANDLRDDITTALGAQFAFNVELQQINSPLELKAAERIVVAATSSERPPDFPLPRLH
ncbi:MAG: HD domain-containing protein [Vicinamibacterales bacterium]